MITATEHAKMRRAANVKACARAYFRAFWAQAEAWDALRMLSHNSPEHAPALKAFRAADKALKDAATNLRHYGDDVYLAVSAVCDATESE